MVRLKLKFWLLSSGGLHPLNPCFYFDQGYSITLKPCCYDRFRFQYGSSRAGKFHPSARHGDWKFWLTSKLLNLLVLKGHWKLLSENKEFVVCAVETGKHHIHKGIWFISSGNIVINLLKAVKRMRKLRLSIATLTAKTRLTVYHTK